MKKLIFSLIFVQAISIVTPFILVLAVTGLLTEAGANVATWVVTVATAISIIESIILGRWGFQTYKTLTTEYLLPPTPKV